MSVQLALFPIVAGDQVRATWPRPDGSTGIHEGYATLVTEAFIYYRCDKPGCSCRLPGHDSAHASHRVGTPHTSSF